MILEIILVFFVLIEGYVIWNLNRKLEHMESWVESFVLRVRDTYNNMMSVDSKGHFEADDEVGTIFEQIKETVSKNKTPDVLSQKSKDLFNELFGDK